MNERLPIRPKPDQPCIDVECDKQPLPGSSVCEAHTFPEMRPMAPVVARNEGPDQPPPVVVGDEALLEYLGECLSGDRGGKRRKTARAMLTGMVHALREM